MHEPRHVLLQFHSDFHQLPVDSVNTRLGRCAMGNGAEKKRRHFIGSRLTLHCKFIQSKHTRSEQDNFMFPNGAMCGAISVWWKNSQHTLLWVAAVAAEFTIGIRNIINEVIWEEQNEIEWILTVQLAVPSVQEKPSTPRCPGYECSEFNSCSKVHLHYFGRSTSD